MARVKLILDFEFLGPLVGMRVISDGVPPVYGYPTLRDFVPYDELEAEYIIAEADMERLKRNVKAGLTCSIDAYPRNV